MEQDPLACYYAQKYINLVLPGIYCFALYDCTRSYLNSMREAFIPMVSEIIGTIVHIFLCYLFVTVYNLGIEGIALAMGITQLIQLIVISIYASL